MTGFIVASHGDFARAALETAEMFAAEQEHVQVIGFYPGDSLEILFERFRHAEQCLYNCDDIVVVTDLKGGSPCNAATAMKTQNPSWRVLTGLSVPLLLQLFENRTNQMSLDESIPLAIEIGKFSLCEITLNS